MLLMALALAAATTAAPPPPVNPAVDACMRAAAVVAHSSVKESDRDGCVCADQQLHRLLHGGDYVLHQDMVDIIASGADEKSFNKQMSDIMLKRGMNQSDADQFLARAKAAEAKTQVLCNTLPPLLPETPPGH